MTHQIMHFILNACIWKELMYSTEAKLVAPYFFNTTYTYSTHHTLARCRSPLNIKWHVCYSTEPRLVPPYFLQHTHTVKGLLKMHIILNACIWKEFMYSTEAKLVAPYFFNTTYTYSTHHALARRSSPLNIKWHVCYNIYRL